MQAVPLVTYTVTRDARRPGQARVDEHFQAPEGVAGAVLTGDVARRRDLLHVKPRWCRITGPVGTLAVRVFTDGEWGQRASRATRTLCLVYLQETSVFNWEARKQQTTTESLLRSITLRTRMDRLLRLAHGGWPPYRSALKWQSGFPAPEMFTPDPRRIITTLVQFTLDRRPWDVALALSTVWGVANGTLRACSDCALPFQVKFWRIKQLRCEVCVGKSRRVRLSPAKQRIWLRVQKRLRFRVYQGKKAKEPLTREECDRLLQDAARETRTLPWAAWLMKWGRRNAAKTRQPLGRPAAKTRGR